MLALNIIMVLKFVKIVLDRSVIDAIIVDK